MYQTYTTINTDYVNANNEYKAEYTGHK